jgi:hypothetical protein
MCPQRTALVTDCTSNPQVVKQRIESMHEVNYDMDWVAVLVTSFGDTRVDPK